MSDIIYTVETGEYSDHAIHAFCTTLDDAKRVAAEMVARTIRDYALDEYEVERLREDAYRWPRVIANPVNGATVEYGKVYSYGRVKWCDADPVTP